MASAIAVHYNELALQFLLRIPRPPSPRHRQIYEHLLRRSAQHEVVAEGISFVHGKRIIPAPTVETLQMEAEAERVVAQR